MLVTVGGRKSRRAYVYRPGFIELIYCNASVAIPPRIGLSGGDEDRVVLVRVGEGHEERSIS